MISMPFDTAHGTTCVLRNFCFYEAESLQTQTVIAFLQKLNLFAYAPLIHNRVFQLAQYLWESFEPGFYLD